MNSISSQQYLLEPHFIGEKNVQLAVSSKCKYVCLYESTAVTFQVPMTTKYEIIKYNTAYSDNEKYDAKDDDDDDQANKTTKIKRSNYNYSNKCVVNYV